MLCWAPQLTDFMATLYFLFTSLKAPQIMASVAPNLSA